MDLDDDDDEVVAEYPLYAASVARMMGGNADDMRLLQLQYPLRPPWRGYAVDDVQQARYKPKHRILDLVVPEDVASTKATPLGEPQKPPATIHLTGTGTVPQVPICAMCKVSGSFVLMPIDEVVAMRPNMTVFAAAQRSRDDSVRALTEDHDYVPPRAAAAAANKVGQSGKPGKPKAALKTVNVEMAKRETERQAAMRKRSHTFLREQIDREAWRPLKFHDLGEGSDVLKNACETLIQQFPADVPMGMPEKEYLRIISPATWLQRKPAKVSGPGVKDEPVEAMTAEGHAAAKQALEALFQDQPIVALDDVRIWLRGFTAAPKAAAAAAQPDAALTSLLLGGGSIQCIRGRFVLKPVGDPFRELVLRLLEASEGGVRKADVMHEAAAAGIEVSEHTYSKVLKELCVAQGSLWNLKAYATFRGR